MKKFFGEFKTFITRGNVVDMAVGVIVGSAFTAIVNGMSNYILKPLVNWLLALLLGADNLSDCYTMLKPAYMPVLDDSGVETGETVLDLSQSIYIDWGALINSIINFFLIALVLFTIVRLVNRLREGSKKVKEGYLDREERRELRAHGIKLHDIDAIKNYFAQKKQMEEEAIAAAAAEAEEQARLEREANPTAEDLLKLILAELKKESE